MVGGPLYDAQVHTFFLGFVLSTIFAHAPLMLPAITGRTLPFHPGLYGPLMLLHGSLPLRIGSDLLGLPPVRQVGGLLNVVAVLAILGQSARLDRPSLSRWPGIAGRHKWCQNTRGETATLLAGGSSQERMAWDLLTALEQTPLFHRLDRAALAAVLAVARRQRAPAGRLFFREGEPARWLYVLEHGRVKLTQTGLDGHRVIVRLIGPGDLFGGIAALAETVYPVSAEAVEDRQALAWSGPTVERLFLAHPQTAVNVLRHLAQRVLELQDRLRELSTERVEQRLARALVRLLT